MPHNYLLVPTEPWHLESLSLREEQRKITDWSIDFMGGVENYINTLVSIAVQHDNDVLCKTVLCDGKIVFIAGLYYDTPYTSVAWALFSEDFTTGSLGLKRFCVKTFKENIQKAHTHRVKASTEVEFKEAGKFLEACGLSFEGIEKGASPFGGDMALYGLKKDNLNE